MSMRRFKIFAVGITAVALFVIIAVAVSSILAGTVNLVHVLMAGSTAFVAGTYLWVWRFVRKRVGPDLSTGSDPPVSEEHKVD